VFFLLASTCNSIYNIDCRIVHSLVLTRVLIYYNARIEKYIQYGAFVNVDDLHRYAKDASHTVTRPGMVFCET